MGFTENIEEFQGSKVIEFESADDWKGPQFAYRARVEYDDEVTLEGRMDVLLAQAGSEQLSALILGAWEGCSEGNESEPIVKMLVRESAKLPGLRHLFFGEMTYEECEISWINQSDVSPLLTAFPKLESFRVRGGNGLSFSKISHHSLRELAVETGGLSSQTIREIFLCEFPALEHLELFLGDVGYGFDGGVEDLQPLLSGMLFPKLKYLGLMNSEIANDIAAVAVNAPVVSRLETLDLSLGNLDGEGFQSLHGLASFPNLKMLNVSHHFAADRDVEALKAALKCTVIAEDRQEPEDDWRPIVHAE